MKLGIFTDLHANLPALETAIAFFEEQKCNRIIHVGDLIGIGPYPRECMELALQHPKLEFVMGNHDHWYAFGLPNPIPAYMSEEEVAHHQWTHRQIGAQYRTQVKDWPFFRNQNIGKHRLTFLHYGLNETKDWFKPFVKHPISKDLDVLFEEVDSNVIFYGHHHQASDLTGRSRYLNPGSAGCGGCPEMCLLTVEEVGGELSILKHVVEYEDKGLIEAFDKRKVPARDFIRKVFITR